MLVIHHFGKEGVVKKGSDTAVFGQVEGEFYMGEGRNFFVENLLIKITYWRERPELPQENE